MRSDLAQSYGQDRLPRYTSYPTAPHFSPAIGEENYRSWLKSVPVREPASIYLHVPFCRSMCWYCGCHTSVTKRDDPIATYAAGLRTEARLVAETIGQRMPISHVHFGGGTPTIMSPETFVDLVGALRYSFFVLPDAEIAVEIDPRTLTEPMVEALGYCGVNRASLGVQSFDPAVQRAINRLQSFEQTAASVERLRRVGVGRINFDLLYGLPLQTVDSCLDTVAKCVELRPDRFSVFGYAHVPSFKKHQRKIAEDSLPNSIERHLQSETIARSPAGRRLRPHRPRSFRPSGRQSGHRETGRQAEAQLPGLHRRFRRHADRSRRQRHRPHASGVRAERRSDARLSRAHRRGPARHRKGYAFTGEDRFRADIIERIMCDLAVDLPRVSRLHGRDLRSAIVDRPRIESLIADGAVTMIDRSAFDPRRRGIPGAERRIGVRCPSCAFRSNA